MNQRRQMISTLHDTVFFIFSCSNEARGNWCARQGKCLGQLIANARKANSRPSTEDEALRLAQSETTSPTSSSADAIFAFSILTTWYSFASHAIPDRTASQGPLHRTIQCINLLRGVQSVGPSVKQWISQGAMAPLLKLSPKSFKAVHDFPNPDTSAYFSRKLHAWSMLTRQVLAESRPRIAGLLPEDVRRYRIGRSREFRRGSHIVAYIFLKGGSNTGG